MPSISQTQDQTLPFWPHQEIARALTAVAEAAGLPFRQTEPLAPPSPAALQDNPRMSRWFVAAADHFGLEADPFSLQYRQLRSILGSGEPLFLHLSTYAEMPGGYLAILGGDRRKVTLLRPDASTLTIPTAVLIRQIAAPLSNQIRSEVQNAMHEVDLDPAAEEKIIRKILDKRLGARIVASGFHLRLPPSAPFRAQLRQEQLFQSAAAFALAYTGQYFLWIVSWWLLGRAFFQGRFDSGWLWAWLLSLAGIIPLRAAATWFQGAVAIGVGGLLKRRLLTGMLRLESDETRHQGTGQFLSRVLESEAVESLLLGGGFLTFTGLIELIFAVFVLANGLHPTAHVGLILVWSAAAAFLGVRFWHHRRLWTLERLDLTHDLVEQMAGHRTRLAQSTPDQWHDQEDEALARYTQRSAAMDRVAVWLLAGITSGWLVVSTAILLPSLVAFTPGIDPLLAISVGGILSATLALNKLVKGSLQLADAAIAAEQVRDLFEAAGRKREIGTPNLAAGLSIPRDGSPLLSIHHLNFNYRVAGQPVLRDVNLAIYPGDRILLEGESGGGKSSLAALLSGLRQPQSGLILLNGFDRQTIGQEGWRRAIATAPQFHENHVLIGTFAFNLLMGRNWPPSEEDLARAHEVCDKLGLKPLLEHMPAGMLQMVGETGWQLSHGERSRLFLARALLQEADLLIFDESFAALDPHTLARCLETVLEEPAALLVIAHP